ncbi:MAG: SMC-Scp complex subunit ScpB [Candidatus Helarchaeota archaeon]
MPNQEQIKLVEASLFVAGRPINENELMQLTQLQKREELEKIIDKLSKNLEERNSFIEIIKIEDQYMMRIKKEVKSELGDLQIRKSIPDEYLKILAIIALKQPIKTTEIRKIYRATNIKDSLNELERKGFIKIKSEKRAKYVTTTPHFATVFSIDPQNIKGSILRMLTHKIAQYAVKVSKKAKKSDKKKKEVLTDFEKKEIEGKYFELMERLKKEREEEQKRLEEEERRKAEEEEFKKKMLSDPMASLLKKDNVELEIKKNIDNTEDEEIDKLLEELEEEELKKEEEEKK